MTLQQIGLVALAINLVVRLLKSGSLDGAIPARWRPLVAVALGGATMAVDALAAGTPWQDAAVSAALSVAVAIAAHEVGVESLAGGKELGR